MTGYDVGILGIGILAADGVVRTTAGEASDTNSGREILGCRDPGPMTEEFLEGVLDKTVDLSAKMAKSERLDVPCFHDLVLRVEALEW